MRARLPDLGGRDARGRTRLGWRWREPPSALARPPSVWGSGRSRRWPGHPPSGARSRPSRPRAGRRRAACAWLASACTPGVGSLNFAVGRRSPPEPGLRCTGQRSILRDVEITGLTQKTQWWGPCPLTWLTSRLWELGRELEHLYKLLQSSPQSCGMLLPMSRPGQFSNLP